MGAGRLDLGGHQDLKKTKGLFLGIYAARPGLDIWRGQGDGEVPARCPHLHVPVSLFSLCDNPASWVEGRQAAVQEGRSGRGVSRSGTALECQASRSPVAAINGSSQKPRTAWHSPGSGNASWPPGLPPPTLLLYRLPETQLSLAEPGPKSLPSLPNRTPLICLALMLALSRLRRQPPPPFSPSTPLYRSLATATWLACLQGWCSLAYQWLPFFSMHLHGSHLMDFSPLALCSTPEILRDPPS